MPRLLAVTLVTVLLGFTGCGGSADPKAAQNQPAESIDVKLEGTWRGEVIVNEEAAKSQPDAVAVIKTMKMEMTFREDGTMLIVGETNGQSFDDENRWDYVDQTDNKLTIKSITTDGKEKDHDFYFNDSNSFDMPLSINEAQVASMRFKRVR